MGELADATEDLSAFAPRLACSDAERRAALHLHDVLRERGHEAWVETTWVRPQWAWSLAWHALLGVVASLLASAVPVAGLVLAAVVTASYGLELLGAGGLLTRLLVRRATQVVVVEPEDPDAVAVWLHAGTDAPRGGWALTPRARALAERLPLPPRWWAWLCLALVTAAAAARVAGAEGIAGPQLVPTVGLLLALAAGVDVALARPADGVPEAAAAAVAVELLDDLRAAELPGLSAGLVLSGAAAGPGAPPALRAWLRENRPDPARALLVDVGPCGDGPRRWWARQPQLRAALAGTGAPRRRGRPGAAGAVRRLPVAQVAAGRGPGGEAAAEAVRQLALDALGTLELAPVQARSRAKAANQS